MTRHHQQSADILPFGQPDDPGPRYVQPSRTLVGIYNKRLDGKPRCIVIDPQPSWTGTAIMFVVAALIGAMLAIGHSL